MQFVIYAMDDELDDMSSDGDVMIGPHLRVETDMSLGAKTYELPRQHVLNGMAHRVVLGVYEVDGGEFVGYDDPEAGQAIRGLKIRDRVFGAQDVVCGDAADYGVTCLYANH